MTGYGQSRVTRDGVTLSADIQCLNSRFFDLTARLPRIMQKWELPVRQKAQESLVRGKVNITVVVTTEGSADTSLRLNLAMLRQYQELYRQIREELALKERPSLSHYTAVNNIIETEEIDRNDLLRELLMEALKESLEGVNEMRKAEGGNLATDLTRRLALVQEETESIERLPPES